MDKRQLREREFPITRNYVYLNHASVGPLSRRTCEAMTRHAEQQRDSGALFWRDWYAEYRKFRSLAARLIGATPSDISVLKNTSEGLSFVAAGLIAREGDNVVTTDMEFPSNYIPWKRLERRGIECRLVRNRDGRFGIEDLEPLVDSRTKAVAVSSVSFHNGFRPDLVAIGELCASRGALFVVDGIQSVGALSIDVRKAKISFLIADGHKWLLGPEGTTIFYSAPEAREKIEVLESGWMNTERDGKFIGAGTELRKDGRRFEAGSLNTNGIYGVTASLEFLLEVGIDAIEREVIGLARYLASRLGQIGWEVRSPQPVESGIVGAVPRSIDLERLRGELGTPPTDLVETNPAISLTHAWLEKRGIICAPREGMLRFSPHFYNDESDIDRVIEALEELA